MTTQLKIENLECLKQQAGLSNVVIRASWRLFGTIDETTDSIYGEECFSQPDPNNFIPVEDLTEQEILSWMNLDIPKLEILLLSQMQDKANSINIKKNFIL
jgi:hypothetical protein